MILDHPQNNIYFAAKEFDRMNMSVKDPLMKSGHFAAGDWVQNAQQKPANTLETSQAPGDQMQCHSILDREIETVDLHMSPLNSCEVRYQIVCTHIDDHVIGSYDTYGIQCMCKWSDTWIQFDSVTDISLHSEKILCLVSQFIALGLSPLHFRDAVLDSISD